MTAKHVAATGPRAGTARPRLAATSPRYGEKAIKGFLGLCAALSVATTATIVVSLVVPAVSFFREVPVTGFLAGTRWAPAFADATFGVLPLVAGTFMVVVFSLLVAVPVGLLSATYLSEYASPRVRRVVKPVIEVLAGIPTVAIGFFALYFLRPLAEDLFPFLPWRGPFSVGVAGVAVGLLIVPLVTSVSDDAMRSVPADLRRGAYALGASKPRVCLRVVLPAAISGIVASIVLAGSRAVGETMVVLIAAGATPHLGLDPSRSMLAMTGYIGQTATGDIAVGSVQYDTIFAVGSLLFVITLLLNLAAIRLVRRFREVYE